MDDKLNTMYLDALQGFKSENEMLLMNYIAFKTMVDKILRLPPKCFIEGDKDAYLSLTSINEIVKEELDKLTSKFNNK
jgi:hypothetical protein